MRRCQLSLGVLKPSIRTLTLCRGSRAFALGEEQRNLAFQGFLVSTSITSLAGVEVVARAIINPFILLLSSLEHL
jgi:hypothetical protein